MRLETEEDRYRQTRIAQICCLCWRCEYGSFGGPNTAFDIYLKKDTQLIGFVEIKARRRKFADFDSCFLNLEKWVKLRMLQMSTGFPVLYVVAFEDGIYYSKISDIAEHKVRISVRGREDRPKEVAPNDVAPLAEIENWRFKKIAETPADLWEAEKSG